MRLSYSSNIVSQVELSNNNTLSLKTPGLLPELSTINRISTSATQKKIFPASLVAAFNKINNKSCSKTVLYVQQKENQENAQINQTNYEKDIKNIWNHIYAAAGSNHKCFETTSTTCNNDDSMLSRKISTRKHE